MTDKTLREAAIDKAFKFIRKNVPTVLHIEYETLLSIGALGS